MKNTWKDKLIHKLHICIRQHRLLKLPLLACIVFITVFYNIASYFAHNTKRFASVMAIILFFFASSSFAYLSPEAQELALAIELFTNGSLNTFAQPTNVDTNNKLVCYNILELGEQLLPVGMLVVLDNILNRITSNRRKGRTTYIFIDEIYLLFAQKYTADFLYLVWKRVRKYGAFATGITQNVGDMLQSHTASTMLSNSEFVVMLNQSGQDKNQLAKLLNISDNQTDFFTNVDAGQGLMKIGSNLVPYVNKFPKNTELYKL